MATGITAFRAVFWATVVAVAVSFVPREHRLTPRRLARALAAGGAGVVPVVATTAAAGIIVGVVTLTGLGLKAASLIVTLAHGQPGSDGALFGARGVGARARRAGDGLLHHRGGHGRAGADAGRHPGDGRAHVRLLLRRAGRSQPADGALAVCRRGVDRWQSVPDDDGRVEVLHSGVCGAADVHAERARPRCAAGGVVADIVLITVVAAIGVAALAAGTGGFLTRAASTLERALLVAGGLLMFGGAVAPVAIATALIGVAVVMHWRRGIVSHQS